jgi:hypothetical protein
VGLVGCIPAIKKYIIYIKKLHSLLYAFLSELYLTFEFSYLSSQSFVLPFVKYGFTEIGNLIDTPSTKTTTSPLTTT